MKIYKKTLKRPPNHKNRILKKIWKCSISNSTKFSQPKFHIPKWKPVTGSMKLKIY